MNRFDIAKAKITEVISRSKTEEDPSHSLNALHWLLELKPDADEILQLAALAHDIERAMPDRFTKEQFKTYDEYKAKHAERAGELAVAIVKESGYSEEDAKRIYAIIKDAEFGNSNPDVNLVMDADSLSFFDNNVNYYLARNGDEITKEKARFMFDRASVSVRARIQLLLAEKKMTNLL